MWLLAFAALAGCVDAVSYTRLGTVFTANMTGNTVLLGIALARLHWADFIRSALALVGFGAGALLGTRGRRGRLVFVVQAAVLAAAAVLGASGLRLPAVAAAASAMGLQTAALRERVPDGVKVTYVTGTATTTWARVADPDTDRASARLPALVWIVYGLGGLGGALLGHVWGAPALLVPAGVALVAGRVSGAPR